MPDALPSFVWLHGFASSPQSSKARFMRDRLAARGVTLHIPDLNLPRFHSLTVGRMLGVVDALAAQSANGQLVLCGSSLGGYTAAVWAAQNPSRCRSLVLLAPAFALARRWQERMDQPELARWRASGEAVIEHYAWGTKEPLSAFFLAEAELYEEFPLPQAPTLVLQGTKDEVVEPALAREFDRRMQSAKRQCQLLELDDGHELGRDLPGLWTALEKHLGAILPPPAP